MHAFCKLGTGSWEVRVQRGVQLYNKTSLEMTKNRFRRLFQINLLSIVAQNLGPKQRKQLWDSYFSHLAKVGGGGYWVVHRK